MKEKGFGGANTKTGLVFEGKTDLATFLMLKKVIMWIIMVMFITLIKQLQEFSKSIIYTCF